MTGTGLVDLAVLAAAFVLVVGRHLPLLAAPPAPARRFEPVPSAVLAIYAVALARPGLALVAAASALVAGRARWRDGPRRSWAVAAVVVALAARAGVAWSWAAVGALAALAVGAGSVELSGRRVVVDRAPDPGQVLLDAALWGGYGALVGDVPLLVLGGVLVAVAGASARRRPAGPTLHGPTAP